jgi:hypothetical protein
MEAIVPVDGHYRRDSLWKILINGLSLVQSQIESIGGFTGTFFQTDATSRAFIFPNIACLFTHLHVEMTRRTLYGFHLAIGQELDPRMSTDIHQLRA